MLIIILRIGVSQKVEITISLTLTVAGLTYRVMLLSISIGALLSLTWLIIIRLGVLGTVRVNIFKQSRHERPHIIAVAFESP